MMNSNWLVKRIVAGAVPLAAVALWGADPAVAPTLKLGIARGPFEPTMDSLTNYHCPDWFRDAKFGIWAHWGPQAVPMAGDWYAKHLYVQGHRQYQHHLDKYGHPSTNGYKDIIPLWKAEQWNPDRLMALYKRAGARYFVSMASHHDNFYLWNSKLHRWNAVNMGPQRDVVGEWQQAAKKLGLRFGVSEHLGASFTWFQDSHKSDKSGPLAGVAYDGADPKYQDLYHFPADPDDKGWYSKNPRWQQQWFDRIKELVDNYQPDLLYTDGGVPFGNEVGRSLIAHLYNQDAARHGGQAEVVYTCKQRSDGRWIEDLERGVMPRINPHPWQTDTSIGDWFYNENWRFRPVTWTIYMLVDIVAKNGNLLLNVVQRPDGSLDAEVEQALEVLGRWIAIHGEAIYETRPWLLYGEGAVRYKGGNFGEDFRYTSRDIRFTTKGATLYAISLGWPKDGQLLVRSLAKPPEGNGNQLASVSLLGHPGPVEWTQNTNGLAVVLPEPKGLPYTATLKITGANLKPVEFEPAVPSVSPDAKGNFKLAPGDAELHGTLKQENQGGQPNLGFWDNGGDWAAWKVKFDKAGTFKVSASVATVHANAQFVVESAGQALAGTLAPTSAWDQFRDISLGQLNVAQAGEQLVKVRAKDAASWKAINLRAVHLVAAAP